MGRQDRRQRTALDEAYRYYKQLESGESSPDIFRLIQAVKTLSFALAVADFSEFKLTKQLWKRLLQALFDKMITSFSGRIAIFDENRSECPLLSPLPENGYLKYYGYHLRRSDDVIEMDLGKLFPKTYNAVRKVWQERGASIQPSDFEGSDCEGGVCFMRPLVLGQEVLGEESQKGHAEAHSRWWELYWQAYCSSDKQDLSSLTRQMNELETVWGNLYY